MNRIAIILALLLMLIPLTVESQILYDVTVDVSSEQSILNLIELKGYQRAMSPETADRQSECSEFDLEWDGTGEVKYMGNFMVPNFGLWIACTRTAPLSKAHAAFFCHTIIVGKLVSFRDTTIVCGPDTL